MSNLELKRIVMDKKLPLEERFKAQQTDPGRGKNFTRKMHIDQFKKILNDIVPKGKFVGWIESQQQQILLTI